MPLNLYRRHRPGCEGGHKYDSRSGEFEERKKTWRRCSCPIFASGTLQNKFRRQTTAQWEWTAAKEIAGHWEAANKWGKPTSPISPTAAARITMTDAASAFLAEREVSGAPNTYRKALYLMNAVKTYSEKKGYIMVEQWTTLDVREFRSSWDVAAILLLDIWRSSNHFSTLHEATAGSRQSGEGRQTHQGQNE